MIDFSYDAWPSGEPYEWLGCRRSAPYDTPDFHVDLGCGTIKKGRIGIDRYPAPGVNIVMDLDKLAVYGTPKGPGEDAHFWESPAGGRYAISHGLPFAESSIESIISHHVLEHIGDGFIPLIDEVYRVLKPDGLFRAITPLFPSRTAVEDPDHRRYFMERTWEGFCGEPDNCWLSSFSVPYTRARFKMLDRDMTPVRPQMEWHDDREMRVALEAKK